ncbi:MAG TPA: HNH endonuclease [Abditibacterium sp.]
MNLDFYVNKFRKLNQDRNGPWTEATNGRAPHKPFLLLAVLDLAEEGNLARNFIELSPDLGEIFSIYWAKVMPADRSGNLAQPFFYLRSEGFWHLQAIAGQEAVLAATKSVNSLNDVRKIADGARLDDDLFALICDPQSRQLLRIALIEACFSLADQPLLLQQSTINVEAYDYSKELLEQARTRRLDEIAQIETNKPAVRDQGFRRAVVTAYNHRCAMCGLRIQTPEGHTVVEGAHIKPWSVSRNDDPRNGVALCRLCHWGFDEGLLGVSPNYLVVVSSQLAANENIPGHLVMMRDREIFKPIETQLWPDIDMVKWHFDKVFRKR